jgi:excisionase family DNA binding protein
LKINLVFKGLSTMLPTTEPIKTRLIALSKVSEITTLGKTSLYQLIAAGELRPIKLGRKTVFAEAEIHEWVNQRLANRGKTRPLAHSPLKRMSHE